MESFISHLFRNNNALQSRRGTPTPCQLYTKLVIYTPFLQLMIESKLFFQYIGITRSDILHISHSRKFVSVAVLTRFFYFFST